MEIPLGTLRCGYGSLFAANCPEAFSSSTNFSLWVLDLEGTNPHKLKFAVPKTLLEAIYEN
jgi:hypothetical protein